MLSIRTLCWLFLLGLPPDLPPVADGYLVLFVTNTVEEPVNSIAFTCKGDCSTEGSLQGKVRLKLPPQTRGGDWVILQIIKRSNNPDWVLISPWDGRVLVPSFDNKAENAAVVVVARRGDRQMLASGKALEAITARVLKEVAQKLDQQISDDERKLVLKQQAEAMGLATEEVDRAIREWGGKAKDPYQQGLAALYEKNFPRATELLTQSYEMRKEAAQKANAEYADAAFFLGQSLYQQGRYSTAVDRFQEVIALRKDDAGVLNWFGISLHQSDRYAEAESVYKRALDIYEKALGREHPSIATSLNNLAGVYADQGKYAEAEPLYKRTLDIYEKMLGREHPSTATGLNNLAVLYRDQGRYAEAEPLLKRALNIREKALGREHPDTASSLNNLAGVCTARGKHTEAEPLFKRALDIREKTLGKEHPDTAASLNNLAFSYNAQGKYSEAEPLLKRALFINEKALGKDHPENATNLKNLARAYYGQMRYAEAEPLYQRSLEIRETALGKQHPKVVEILEWYAELLRKTGREDEANKLDARAKQIRERAKSKDEK